MAVWPGDGAIVLIGIYINICVFMRGAVNQRADEKKNLSSVGNYVYASNVQPSFARLCAARRPRMDGKTPTSAFKEHLSGDDALR